MPVKKTIKSSNKNKQNKRKNLEFRLFYLKFIKIFKIFSYLVLFFLMIFFSFLLYRNNIFSKVFNDFQLKYSNFVYGNICTNIEINGVYKSNIYNIQQKIYRFCDLKNKINMLPLLNEISLDPWVKNIKIKRKLPDTLIINIDEYVPFAIWKDDSNLYLIDENGKIIVIDEKEKREYLDLIIVAGKGSKENIYSLFNLLSSNSFLFSRIKSALRIGERRWNLELDNGIIIKMPESNELEAWDKLNKILSIQGSEINLKTIDLRNKDKVFLEEKNKI